jgi:hypothetical protein
VDAIADEERIIFGGQLDIGTPIDPEQARRLFDLPAVVVTVAEPTDTVRKALDGLLAVEGASMQRDMESETGRWYEQESAKLERFLTSRKSRISVPRRRHGRLARCQSVSGLKLRRGSSTRRRMTP